MNFTYINLKKGFTSGMQKGWSGFIWMLKIILPVSFLTSIFVYSGWLDRLDFFITPVMNLMSLPSVAALPLIAGMLTGIYGGIASMLLLPLTEDQMLLIAIFLLISHSLINEAIVQGKSGINPFTITVIRLTASVITVVVAALFLESETTVDAVITNSSVAGHQLFTEMLKEWSIATFYICLEIFVIIMFLMILLEIMKELNLIDHIIRAMSPVLKIMGLDQRVGILWVTAAAFGVTYGGAVIVEEIKAQGDFTEEQLIKLHISTGINHALIEDPLLFVFIGLNPFWLWVPRLVIAIVAVRAFDLWFRWFRS